ncbi:MAG: PD40 domain-containing protein [Abitibacteriaceae bacterium]|nr:PD40 domain-containing protein [Abditibacteriaceae bacterium]
MKIIVTPPRLWVALNLASLIAIQPAPGQTAATPPNKVLYFTSRVGSYRSSICVMNPDGSHSVNLTQVSNDKIDSTIGNQGDAPHLRRLTGKRDIDPAWAPDGQQIAFTVLNGAGQGEIYRMKADGTQRQRLTQLNTLAACPAWSPDGRHIAFGTFNTQTATGRTTTDICIMEADGSHIRDLGEGFLPAWSPDGRQILYTIVDRPGPAYLYIMNADGSEARQMVAESAAMGAWSPDGQRIAYVGEGNDKGCHIFVMNADTSHRTQLTGPRRNIDSSPLWSVDGQQIFFTRETRDGAPAAVWVMQANGQQPMPLTPAGTRSYLGSGVLGMMVGQLNESLSNLQQIGVALHKYAAQHEGALPSLKDQAALTKELLPYLDDADVLLQPDTDTPYLWNTAFSEQVLENFSKGDETIIVYEAVPPADPQRANHQRNALFLDGHVEGVRETDWPRLKTISHLK